MYKSLIPNILTSANLVLGFCSILSTYNANYTWSTLFILLALVADGLDGRAARFFGVSSEIGKEMDSLCDLVSFGVAPAFLAYSYCLKDYDYFGWAVAIVFALCGAWRLARFNVNVTVVHGFFMGLAIPAGGCLIATAIWFFRSIGMGTAVLEPALSRFEGKGREGLPCLKDFRGAAFRCHSLPRARGNLECCALCRFQHILCLRSFQFQLIAAFSEIGHCLSRNKGERLL